MDITPLRHAVSAKVEPVYMTRKSDIVEYYKDTYGAKNWTSHAAAALSGTTDKKSRDYKSAMRQFQGDRLQKEARKSAGKFEAVGKTLPPTGYKPKDGSITVTVKGQQSGGREREWTATFTGTDAIDFANAPDYKKFFKKMGYPDWVIDEFEGDGDGDSGAVFVMYAA